MATFTDRKSRVWEVDLDAPTIEKIQSTMQISLVDLESDPIAKLRNNPMNLVRAITILCQDQISERKIEPEDFGRSLPRPPDPMIDAIKEAIVSFFPSGRNSHVREVLTTYDELASKAENVGLERMKAIASDPATMAKLDKKATTEFEKAMKDLFPEA